MAKQNNRVLLEHCMTPKAMYKDSMLLDIAESLDATETEGHAGKERKKQSIAHGLETTVLGFLKSKESNIKFLEEAAGKGFSFNGGLPPRGQVRQSPQLVPTYSARRP